MKRLKDIRCFLLDMDGTFYLGDRILEGSLDFIEALGRKNIGYLFLTNNSSRNKEHYKSKLAGMGLETDKILTSGQNAAGYLNTVFPGKRVYAAGNRFFKEELEKYGVFVTECDPQVICLAYDTDFDYKKSCTVCGYVRSGLPYIATHPDFNCPVDGGVVPDIGAMMAYIEASTGRMPDAVLGKPGWILDSALKITGTSINETCIVGDRLYTDIALGTERGMLSVLVLTGETCMEDLENSRYKPDLIFDRLSDVIAYL